MTQMKTAREYARGPVPIDVCLKRVPSLALVDALIARSVAVSPDDPDLRVLSRSDERPLIHKPLAVRFSGPHPEASADRTVVRFVVSSGEEARDDKDLMIEGIDFGGYDLNPVWLFAHDWEGLPIGRCLARRTYKRGGTYELWKDIEFTPEDLHPFGHQVGQMHARGFLRACSGGWMGTRIRVVRGANGAPERVQYLNSDWMETSSCAVGIDKYAVQEAVARGVLKSDGVDQFARGARIAATGVAYEVRMDRTEAAEAEQRAFKPNEKRTLVEEHVMEHNPIGEWKQQAMRAVDGTVPGAPDVVEEEPTPTEEPTPEVTPESEPEATPETESEPESDPPAAAETTESEDATTIRAALGMLRRLVDSQPGVVERGVVSQAVDAAIDSLYANVMVLAQCSEELRCCASSVFYEGRSADDARRVVRARMDALVERMSLLATEDPSGTGMTDAYLERAVNRAEAALARSGNALSEVRDAVSLFSGDVSDPVVRAGKKISAARRERLVGTQSKLAAALAAVQDAVDQLQAVLDEEPEPEAKESAEDMDGEGETITPEEAAAADEAVGRAATDELLARASRLLDARINAPLAARASVVEARFSEISKRTAIVPRVEVVAAESDDDRRIAALAKRASRFKTPGVFLPANARVRS